jgi:capsular polysaccharide biosynthesis protein
MSYPDRMPDVVLSEEGAARLLRLGTAVEVSEPVLVLENFDALYHRNYYHWLIFVLSRINYAKELGLLEGRRLVVPQGLTRWMQASLQAIGLSAAEMLEAPLGMDMQFTDSLICSAVDFAAPTLLKALRAKILSQTGTNADTHPVHLYLSRRANTRRPIVNEHEVEAIAQDLGFTVVQPETMPFVEQARLFSRAASVAGAEGAGFANFIFCAPGTRTLSTMNENDLFPTYNDLSTVMGLFHRKLTGRPEVDDNGMHF